MNSYNGFGSQIRNKSFAWLKAEIAAGRVAPPSRCQACGETRGHLDYHSESYARPFGPHIYAYQLCFRCHMALHGRFRFPARWLRYIEQLEAGAIYEPLMHRGEIGRLNEPGWVERPERLGPPRPRLEFFRGLAMSRSGDRQHETSQLNPLPCPDR